MTLIERIESDFITAYKARETDKVNVLRMLKSALKNEAIKIESLSYVLTDAEALAVINREAKQRRDSISQYEAAGRTDLSEQEIVELKIVETYLPAAMSDEDLAVLVETVISETGATQKSDMGRVMGAIKARLDNAGDVSRAATLISQKLS